MEQLLAADHIGATDESERQPTTKRREPGTKPHAIEEFPTPLFNDWLDPPTFRKALELHMRRHGDSYWHLHRAVVRDDEKFDHSTIRHWMQGSKVPRSAASMEVLGRIERRYRLPAGYFRAKLPYQTRSTSGYVLDDIAPAERRWLAWHLPDDFNTRPRQEQEEILEWVQHVIVRGSTDYRRLQATAMKQRYRQLFILLRHESAPSEINRIYRLYRDEGLVVRKLLSRRRVVGMRAPNSRRGTAERALVAGFRP